MGKKRGKVRDGGCDHIVWESDKVGLGYGDMIRLEKDMGI